METRARWQDKLNLGLGFWLFLSPLLLIDPYSPFRFDLVTVHSLVMGLVVALAAGAALLQFKAWEEWVEIGLGVWIVVSPFILGFSDMTMAMMNHVIVGLVIVADAIWVLSELGTPTHAA